MMTALVALFLAPALAQAGHWDPRITDLRGSVAVYASGAQVSVKAAILRGRDDGNGRDRGRERG